MRSIKTLLFSFAIVASLAITASAVTKTHIIISPRSYATTETLTLAGIARIDGDDVHLVERLRRVSLGYSPVVGTSRTITRDEILSAVESAGIEMAKIDLSMPPKVNVERASQT